MARGLDAAGPVEVELILPAHVRGLRCERVRLPAEAAAGELKLAFDREGCGPFNMPLTVRATLAGKGGPAVAEAQVEIAP